MSNVTIRRLTVELGYESAESDTAETGRPPMAQVFDDLFVERWGRRLAEEETLEVGRDAGDTRFDDTWASPYLEERLNALLKEGLAGEPAHRIRVHEEDLAPHAEPGDYPPSPDPEAVTGDKGTKCKQVGDLWKNSRTYVVTYESDGRLWPDGRDPAQSVALATLNWLCWAPS